MSKSKPATGTIIWIIGLSALTSVALNKFAPKAK